MRLSGNVIEADLTAPTVTVPDTIDADRPKTVRHRGVLYGIVGLALLAIAGYSLIRQRRSERDLRQARHQLATAHVEAAVQLLGQHHRSDGLLKLLEAHEAIDDRDPLAEPIRRLIAGWSRTVGAPLPHDDSVVAVAVSDDGRLAITASHDGTARCWNLKRGQPIGEILYHEDDVVSVALSADGRFAITAGDDNLARIWETASGAPRGKPIKHNGDVQAVAICDDGSLVVTVSGNVAQLWGALNQVAVGAPLKHTAEIRDVAISAAGPHRDHGWRRPRRAAVGHQHRSAAGTPSGTRRRGRGRGTQRERSDRADRQPGRHGSLVDGCDRKTPGGPLAHAGDVVAVALSRDGQTAVTGSRDHSARLWNVPQAESRGPPLRHAGAVLAVAISDDARLVITASEDDTCRFWEGATGRPVGVPKSHDHAVVAIAVSGNAAVAVSGSLDGTARVWRAETDRPLGEPLGTDGNAYRATGSQDGQITLEQTGSHQLLVRHVSSGRLVSALQLPDRFLICHAISPDGKTVVVGCDDHTVQIWDVATGWPLAAPWQHPTQLVSVAFTSNGEVISGGVDEQAWRWPLPTASNSPAESLRLSIEALTGLTHDRSGRTRRLKQHEWLARISQLQELGEPTPTGLADRSGRDGAPLPRR